MHLKAGGTPTSAIAKAPLHIPHPQQSKQRTNRLQQTLRAATREALATSDFRYRFRSVATWRPHLRLPALKFRENFVPCTLKHRDSAPPEKGGAIAQDDAPGSSLPRGLRMHRASPNEKASGESKDVRILFKSLAWSRTLGGLWLCPVSVQKSRSQATRQLLHCTTHWCDT